MATTADPPPNPEAPLTTAQIFDSIGPAYEVAFSDLPEQTASLHWLLDQLSSSGTRRGKCLDIGGGTGKPVCSTLADTGHDVLGIDVSSVMVEAASKKVPNASFQVLDVRDFKSPDASWDVVTIYFSLISDITTDEIRSVIADIYRWLRPGGLFVFGAVPLGVESVKVKWMGYPAMASGFTAEEALDAVKNVGFEVVRDHVTTFLPKAVEAGICRQDEVSDEMHLFVYARKPGG